MGGAARGAARRARARRPATRSTALQQRLGTLNESITDDRGRHERGHAERARPAARAARPRRARATRTVKLLTSDLVDPAQMRSVLEELHAATVGPAPHQRDESRAAPAVRGRDVAGRRAEPAAPPPKSDAPKLYRHTLRAARSRAATSTASRYLQAVERLPWHLYWGRLEVRAGEYPKNDDRDRAQNVVARRGVDRCLRQPRSRVCVRAAAARVAGVPAPSRRCAIRCSRFDAVAADGGPGAAPAPRFRLTAVLISPARRVAIINGKPYQQGAKVGGAEITQIDAQSVRLRDGGEELVVHLGKTRARAAVVDRRFRSMNESQHMPCGRARPALLGAARACSHAPAARATAASQTAGQHPRRDGGGRAAAGADRRAVRRGAAAATRRAGRGALRRQRGRRRRARLLHGPRRRHEPQFDRASRRHGAA